MNDEASEGGTGLLLRLLLLLLKCLVIGHPTYWKQ